MFINSWEAKNKCPVCSKNQETEKISFDISMGDASTFRDMKSNKITNTKYTVYNMIPIALFENFTRIGNVFFLGISLIMLINSSLTPFYNWITIFPLGFYTFFYLIKEIIIYLQERKQDELINSQFTTRGCKISGSMQDNVRWDELEVGDVIQVMRGEIFPADVIILDTGQIKDRSAICFIEQKNLTGKMQLAKKQASYLTQIIVMRVRQKNNYAEFRKKLTGKIEYQLPTTEPNEFQGSLKLKKDPKIEHLTIDNFVARGSILRQTSWVFGLVVYAGMDCKVYNQGRSFFRKRPDIERITQWVLLFQILVVFLLSVVSVIVLFSRQQEITYIAGIQSQKVDMIQFFMFLVLYSQLVPIGIYFIFDLQALYLMLKLKKITNDNYIDLSRSEMISDLGQVQYMLMDKTGTLTDGEFKIESIKFNESTFMLNHDELLQQLLQIYKPHKLTFAKGPTPRKSVRGKSNIYFRPQSSLQKLNKIEFQIENPDFIPSEHNLDFLKPDHNLDCYKITNRHLSRKLREQRPTGRNESNIPLDVDLQESMQGSRQKVLNQSTTLRRRQISKQNNKLTNTYQNDDFIEGLKQSPNTIMESFLKSIAICHEAKVYYNVDDVAYDSPSREEEQAIYFAKSCGYALEKVLPERDGNPMEYIIRTQSTVQRYNRIKVYGINNFTYKRRINSVVVGTDNTSQDPLFKINQQEGQDGGLLIAKGDPDKMKSILVLEEQERHDFETTIEQFKSRGVRIYVYAWKPLSLEQVQTYCKHYQSFKSSLMSQDAGLENLADEMEKGLNLLGYITFKDNIRPESTAFVKLCRDSNIIPWMITGDARQNALSVAFQTTMINSEDKLFEIKSIDRYSIQTEMRSCLGQYKSMVFEKVQNPFNNDEHHVHKEDHDQHLVRKSLTLSTPTSILQKETLKQMQKFYILVNGASLKIIFEDQYLYKHFCFLACVTTKLIAYNLTPQQKKTLCQIIQTKFPYQPIVAAIGDGLNDKPLLKQANVGIEFVKQVQIEFNIKQPYSGKFLPLVNCGDIKISNLRILRNLILVEGGNKYFNIIYYLFLSYFRSVNVINFLIHKSVLLGVPIFLFNWYSSFTGSTLHDSIIIILYNFILSLPNFVVMGLIDQPCHPIILDYFPALHIDSQQLRKFKLSRFLINSVIEGLLQAFAIFFLSIHVVKNSVNIRGQRGDLTMLSTIVMLSLIIVFNFKVMFTCTFNIKGLRLSYISSLIAVALLTIYLGSNVSEKVSKFNLVFTTQQIFSRFDTLMCLFYNIMSCLLVSYFVNYVIRPWRWATLYMKLASYNLEGLEWRFWKNDTILQKERKQKLNLNKVVRQIFNQSDMVDSHVQEIINSGDTKVTEMKLNKWTLSIVNTTLDRKYLFQQLRESLKYYRMTFLSGLVSFGIYSLTAALTSDGSRIEQSLKFIRLGLFLLLLLIFLGSFIEQFVKRYYNISVHLVGFVLLIKIIYDWFINDINIALSGLLLCALPTLSRINLTFIWTIIYITLYLMLFVVRMILLYFNVNILDTQERIVMTTFLLSPSNTKLVAIYACTSAIVLMLFACITLNYTYYMGVKEVRQDYLTQEQIELESQLTDDILSILVPPFVKQHMAQGKYTMEEAQDDVSILFLYICDFDSILREEGKNVVHMLDNLFRVYDNLCLQHGVQKIETVGYTYMAAAGIKACEIGFSSLTLNIEKTMRLVNLAFDMKKQVNGKVYGAKNTQVEIKVGIHTGRVIAGVIGHHKPQFSLIGDPVNYTSRVASTGEVGAITLSDAAYHKARASLKWYKKVFAEMKGIGQVVNYIVYDERPANLNDTNFQKKVRDIIITQKRKQTYKKMVSIKEGAMGEIDLIKKQPSIDNRRGSRLNLNPLKGLSRGSGMQMIQKIFNKKQQEPAPQNIVIEESPDQKANGFYDDEEDVYEDQAIDPKLVLKPDKYFLTIPNSQAQEQSDWRLCLKNQKFHSETYLLLLVWLIYTFQTLIMITVISFFSQQITVFIMRIVFALLLLPVTLHGRAYQSKDVLYFYLLLFCYGALTPCIQSYFTDVGGIITVGVLEVMIIFIAASNISIFSFVHIILITLTGVIGFFILQGIKGQLRQEHAFFLCFGVAFIFINKYTTQLQQIISYNSLQINQARKLQIEDFVSQLLPTHAFQKLKQFTLDDRIELTDEFEEVTILFADIKGFTSFSNSVQPEAVVSMLRSLFTEFDKMCLKYRLYKVYTIGDCYVVMGFIDSANRNPELEALNVVKMGLSMVQIIREVRTKINFHGLDMRIGVHTGRIIGGIVGTSIVRYDIYGQDVSIANKMESNGVEGNIMVSETTKRILERIPDLPYDLQFHQCVKIEKFRTEINAYLIQLRKDSFEESVSQSFSQEHNNEEEDDDEDESPNQ